MGGCYPTEFQITIEISRAGRMNFGLGGSIYTLSVISLDKINGDDGRSVKERLRVKILTDLQVRLREVQGAAAVVPVGLSESVSNLDIRLYYLKGGAQHIVLEDQSTLDDNDILYTTPLDSGRRTLKAEFVPPRGGGKRRRSKKQRRKRRKNKSSKRKRKKTKRK